MTLSFKVILPILVSELILLVLLKWSYPKILKRLSLSVSDKNLIGIFLGIFLLVNIAIIDSIFHMKNLIYEQLKWVFIFSNLITSILLFRRIRPSIKNSNSELSFLHFRNDFELLESTHTILSLGFHWWIVSSLFIRHLRRRSRLCPQCNKIMKSKESIMRNNKIIKTGQSISDTWKCSTCQHEKVFVYNLQNFYRDCPKCGGQKWTILMDTYDLQNPILIASSKESWWYKCNGCGHQEKFETIDVMPNPHLLNPDTNKF